MTDKSAREIAARGHCRATCGYAKISGTPCETKCTAPDFNLLHGGHYGAVDDILAALEAGGFELRKKGAPVSWPTTTHETAGQAICAGCGGTIMRAGGGTVYIAGTQWFHSPQCAAMLAASNPKEEGK